MQKILSSTSDLRYDKTSLPSLQRAWTDADANLRIGRPVITTFGELGVTDLPAQATCVAYLDAQDHRAFEEPDDRHRFDDLDLDRLFNYATYREWSRHEKDPRRGIALMGFSGNGKTTYLHNRFAQRGIPLYQETGNPDMMAADLLQTKEIGAATTYWSDGPLKRAMLEGVPFLFNEMNNLQPSQATALNEVYEKGRALNPEDGSVIVAKRGFQVFATCNGSLIEDRTGAFKGMRGQNQSVDNRFFKYWVPYPTPEREAECILQIHPEIGPELASRMAAFADYTRKAADPDGSGVDGKMVSQGLSRRHLLDWADMLNGMAYLKQKGDKIDLASYTLNYIYTSGLAAEEKSAIEHFLMLAFNA